ncbi:sulfate adenylyltransferase subunit CysN [Blastochloris viridis]|uniref:Multifunctional fusion protein n=1 Tax=Blastochloris viridis TaxID=1079 RepID=A0A0H5BQ34_BLAVI|nr:sulfate adenylyltransferase subunit CysN [Blastochloris viridis]ALK09822.1 Bifunctional enzyme CysN/CysC [Blastochloris viridis]BAS00274.1 sulfate adenylyltransferase subunit 1 [Blastochloris viridis]CUU42485.1 Bifunctional enzyme CysN/CysC [Blastochloris viridis]
MPTAAARAVIADAPAPLPHHKRSELRFITCGSVDDGKSTLIGRLLFEANGLFQDQIATLERDSRRFGTTGGEIDFALLLDGLEAEREQGITIDVAYRFFSTARRAFIVADTPGHKQYTRNMATGASNADFAVLLVDARRGLLEQTRRHAAIVSLLGIRHVALAINKIDLVGFSQEVFDEITVAFKLFAAPLGFALITAIPLSARFGDNVAAPSTRTPWYAGPTLLDLLESVDVEPDRGSQPFRLPVQWVNRPSQNFRGFAGTIASGEVNVGDVVIGAASGHSSRVARIVTFDGDLRRAVAGQAVTLTLEDELDIARGDVLAAPRARPTVSRFLAADVVWMDEEPGVERAAYLLKAGTATVPAVISRIASRLAVETLEREEADSLPLNGIGRIHVETTIPIAIDPYDDNRTTGSFILIDRTTHRTVAAGLIRESLGVAQEIHAHGQDVTPATRAFVKTQTPLVVWLTGLSGSGKSTIANLVERRLVAQGFHTMLLDGDNLRQGLNSDLGFDALSRTENVRRVGEVARLLHDAGLIVVAALVSPFRADRARVAALLPEGRFLEVFVDAPLEVCRERDPKGLYAKAEAGRIKHFTGRDQTYEAPVAPALVLRTDIESAQIAAEQVVRLVIAHARGAVPGGDGAQL